MKSTLKIGLITAAVDVVFLFGLVSLVLWLNERNSWGLYASTIQGVGGLLSIPIQAIGIYIAMQNFKKINGWLTYGQAVKTGIMVAITIAIIVAVFSFLYCKVLNPGFADFMLKDAQKAMLASGKTQEQILKSSEAMSAQFSAGSQVFMALVGQFVVGTIISLIIGLFVKKQKAG